MTAVTKIFHDRLQVILDNHVAEVRLDHAERHNCMDVAMIDALLEAQVWLAERVGVRAVVLLGEGESFCSGLDVAAVVSTPERIAWLLQPDATGMTPAQRLALGWRDVGGPVVAALHGHVFGAGLQMALAADIRIVHPEASLALPEIEWGLVADMGVSVSGAALRQDVIHDMMLTGRHLSGEEAVILGLASRLDEDPREGGRELAQSLALRSPRAVAAARRLRREAPAMSERECLERESGLQRNLIGGPEQREATRARLEGRRPRLA
ncbi:enoyl-CoA hydratase-related protein [Halomonas binhaiensis]|uniref:Enoyl-CoA hydratase/isomerase family protein n=1 Tax=Halomonas binhaiensis TaxID=2562282 RepID=A0A5C1NKJ7_9GAMM|nr:enoyl-CoA hydratase-related protein [Halomonas binhaiensis]QEM82917.1 enoyl-CoA hydratase/isomerase family protein [Halomonas binhaiensis]